jgi:hypothetical protein
VCDGQKDISPTHLYFHIASARVLLTGGHSEMDDLLMPDTDEDDVYDRGPPLSGADLQKRALETPSKVPFMLSTVAVHLAAVATTALVNPVPISCPSLLPGCAYPPAPYVC